ncbi:MAG: transposase [Tannerellaceae bacterium]|jgi:REP element-mobilizing transposase RayT|nr:transposase [Tannerellaceae bacterium]
MTHSLSKLYVHIIFHVKTGSVLIRPGDENELYAYIGGIIKDNASFPIKINGTENHVHVLSTMSKNISLADFVEEIKKNSSRWIKTKGKYYECFAWQSGYAGYSVSQTKVAVLKRYIEQQKQHHQSVSVRDEYLQFLREYSVDFDGNYLWT